MSYEAEALMGSYVSDDEIIFRLENLAGPLPPVPSSWKKPSKQKHAKRDNLAALDQKEEASYTDAPPSKEAETAELAALLADLQRAVAHTGAPAVARSTKLVKKRVNRKPKAAAEGEGGAPEPAVPAAGERGAGTEENFTHTCLLSFWTPLQRLWYRRLSYNSG